MSGNLFLDWPAMAVSLFNTVLLTWLGLTVLLNSDRRTWGVWLASGGLLLGALFFVSHTAILGLGLAQLGWWSFIFWWTVGLVPAIALPFGWYMMVLWYAGFWNDFTSPLYRRQRVWFLLTLIILLVGLGSLATGVVLLAVSTSRLVLLRQFMRIAIGDLPLLALGYSVYVVLCIGLALDALRRPGPPRRAMAALARQRAHPWLVGTSVALLIVSLLVAGLVLWVVRDDQNQTFYTVYVRSAVAIAWLDFITATIVALAVVLLGQAVVSYEVFTGKTLPRRGLARHWRQAVMLAAGYGILVGGSITWQLRPIYSLLLTTLLMTFFYALISWRSFTERERYMASLRPFVSSQRLYDQLLTQSAPPEVDVATPFRALCADVLGARLAYLVALGPLAPLVGPPLRYPDPDNGRPPPALPLPSLAGVITRFHSPETMNVPVDPEIYGGAVWAIPLWSERGLIGFFFLGEKRDGGLYTQEEMEIARVSGERLIDAQASAEMARRLMALQRQRLAQSQVIDRQTRRVLHDDILPTLQAAMIALSSHETGQPAATLDLLGDAHRQISDLLHQMPTTRAPEVARLGLIRALRRAVDDELGHAFDEVSWQIAPEAEQQARQIPTLTAEVIFYAAREAIRNAARYGRGAETRSFCLRIAINWRFGLELQIEDNGVGLGAVTHTAESSGQGLALHSTMMAVVGGALVLESAPGEYTRVTLTLNNEP